MIARERGLEPLADRILAQPGAGDPSAEAAAFVDAVEGGARREGGARGRARHRRRVGGRARRGARAACATRSSAKGSSSFSAVKDKTTGPTKFETYYDFRERGATIPSHRFLAIRRGEGRRACCARRSRSIATGSPRRFGAMVAGARVLAVRRASFGSRSTTRSRACSCPSVEGDVRIDLKLRCRSRRGRASSPRTSASCSSPRRSGDAWCSASIRGSAPAANAPSSTTPASSSSTR